MFLKSNMSGDILQEQLLYIIAALGLQSLFTVERECLVFVNTLVLAVVFETLSVVASNITAFCVCLYATLVLFGLGDKYVPATVAWNFVDTGNEFEPTVVIDLVEIK